MSGGTIGKLLREPLLHFLLLGFALFAVYGWLGGRAADDEVVITRGRIAHLVASFEAINQRPPMADELKGLVDEAIREEVYYREAKALGLDQDDTIVRRRLSQKLEFVSEDVAPIPEPTEAQLREYLRTHPEQFRAEARYSLAQVYLDPQRHGERLANDAQAVLTQLRRAGADANVGKLGDALLLERRFENVTASELTRLFGAPFEAALRAMPAGQWQGPVSSGYGVHLVFISKRDDGQTAALELIRDKVRREWIYAQRKQANERFYADLRQRYAVTIERPAASGAVSALGGGQ